MNVLEVERLHAAYRKNTVLNNVSFTIQSGSLTGIVGPNGAGKSTLIKSIASITSNISQEKSPFSEHP